MPGWVLLPSWSLAPLGSVPRLLPVLGGVWARLHPPDVLERGGAPRSTNRNISQRKIKKYIFLTTRGGFALRRPKSCWLDPHPPLALSSCKICSWSEGREGRRSRGLKNTLLVCFHPSWWAGPIPPLPGGGDGLGLKNGRGWGLLNPRFLRITITTIITITGSPIPRREQGGGLCGGGVFFGFQKYPGRVGSLANVHVGHSAVAGVGSSPVTIGEGENATRFGSRPIACAMHFSKKKTTL